MATEVKVGVIAAKGGSFLIEDRAPDEVLPPEDLDESYLAGLTGELPLQRRGYPQDIAEAVLYLLGASFVMGQVLFVDGGQHIRMGGNT